VSRSRSLSIHRKDERSNGKSFGLQIYVGNLPYSVDKNQLKEAFKDFGKITHADVVMDDRGKSRGYGTVLFTSKKDADEAIATMD
jgi:RNA recognition motif-containing protein